MEGLGLVLPSELSILLPLCSSPPRWSVSCGLMVVRYGVRAHECWHRTILKCFFTSLVTRLSYANHVFRFDVYLRTAPTLSISIRPFLSNRTAQRSGQTMDSEVTDAFWMELWHHGTYPSKRRYSQFRNSIVPTKVQLYGPVMLLC